MRAPGGSYAKVRYDLRPAKQVERLMLIDAFRRLERADFPIADYRYVGMGSVHFYDYLLFHKYLGISKMTSAEVRPEVKKRVKFNRPYKFVDIVMRPIGDVIHQIPPDEKVVLWLDYDDRLEAQYLRDLGVAIGRLAPGTVVLLTVDIEPPPALEGSGTAEFYRQRLGPLIPASWPSNKFTTAGIVQTVLTLVDRAVRNALQGRTKAGVTFEPIACFTYRDGHRMLSMGGIIATEHERRRISRARLDEEAYYTGNLFQPFEINVPVLTRRERLYLDAKMPAVEGWRPVAFELSDTDVESYRKIYRFTPLFAELVV